jgi:hypothetical protein
VIIVFLAYYLNLAFKLSFSFTKSALLGLLANKARNSSRVLAFLNSNSQSVSGKSSH